jgi:NADH-ubiquinone oxidoreductase chain 6
VSFVFISLTHPITIGLILIGHTVIIGVVTGIISSNFWFSYILFLVFLGGVLVLFIYITRLAANEKFIFSWGGIVVGGSFMLLIFLGLTLSFFPRPELLGLTGWGLPWGASLHLGGMVVKLYSSESYLLTLFLIFYLLYALVVCANLVGGYPGALRNFN